jgi:hypothetical protein
MLLSQNPHSLTQYYKRHNMSTPVAVNIDFVDTSDFCALVLFKVYGYSRPLTTFLNKIVLVSNASVDISTHNEFQCKR